MRRIRLVARTTVHSTPLIRRLPLRVVARTTLHSTPLATRLQLLCTHTKPQPAIPEADSLSEDDFRRLPVGGASAYNMGEFGASPKEMKAFWLDWGVDEGHVLDTLTQRAKEDGGVWTDPPTLTSRLEALERLLPLDKTQYLSLLKHNPFVLQLRPETVRDKVFALNRLLPRADVLDMASRVPNLLCRSIPWLEQKVGAVKTSLPRSDMESLIEEYPLVLLIPSNEFAARVVAIRRSYVQETIGSWDRERVNQMLNTSSSKLQRLEFIEGLNPALRVALPDRKILYMRDKSWQLSFVQRKRQKFHRGVVRPEPVSRDFDMLQGVAVPTHGNLLELGRQITMERRLLLQDEQQQEEEAERRAASRPPEERRREQVLTAVEGRRVRREAMAARRPKILRSGRVEGEDEASMIRPSRRMVYGMQASRGGDVELDRRRRPRR